LQLLFSWFAIALKCHQRGIDRASRNAIIDILYIVVATRRPSMRSLIALLLLALSLTTGCRPLLSPETLAAFVPDRLPLTQSVAAALKPATATESRFVILYPELRTAAAPTWLRPATRVTYRVGTATFADPRFPRNDPNQPNPTPSAEGLVQYDVIAQNRRNVVFLSSLINTQIAGTPPAPLSYQVSLPGSGEFWFSPAVLETAESAASEVFQVTRMPLTVEGVEYDVVRMQTNSTIEQGSGEEVWAFDTATGILVFYRQALYRLDGSQSSGTTMTLLAQRQVRIPWRNGSVPEWVEAGLELQFSGSHVLDVGAGNPVPLPMSSISRITSVGPLWSEHAQQVYLYGQDGGSSVTATGPMQIFGGYWLPPQALSALETGEVLDQDPLTGIQTSVVQANRRQIVLAAAGPGHVTQLYYDARDGRLVGIYMEQHTPTGTLYTTLEAVN
jgi:hypothetical protein